jgi:acyl-coenzyme A thioesterase 13
MLDSALAIMQGRLGQEITDSKSAAGNWLQPTLMLASVGKIRISMEIKPEMGNPYGNIHGGMMSLLIDEVIGWAVVSMELEQHYTSVSLNIDFLYAAKVGERIEAEAEVIRQGKKIINASVQVFNQNGILLSKATSNLVVTSMKIKNNN